ncbi:translation elongation factor Ts [Candidatus Peregrinibacteria bacterium]|nr:MAG: translation elongation factor Ts [Candidatus Peregrinibacteria bacterium]
MNITAAQVNDLRKRTGVSMMECKNALTEANGDEEKAIEILRKRGAAKAAKKADRDTTEGVVLTETGNGKTAMVKMMCETDFVAKNEEFIAIGQAALKEALANGAEAAMQKEEPALKELFAKLGENMSMEVEVMEGDGVGTYVHSNNKIGVMVNLAQADEEKARDVAMHIAAMDPAVISPSEVSEDLVAKERDIWMDQLQSEGKPADIMEKIMLGKEKKFREEAALLKQAFVKNPDQTIEQFLSGNTVTKFVRIAI